jgi:hypothetical protein
MKNNLSQSQLGWHSRGYLPHFEGGELAQFITFRLHDALPGSVLARWKEELKLEKPGEIEALMRRRVEAYLDQGDGSCYLKEPGLASMVQNALLFHEYNPVAARLCEKAEDWPFSSASWRKQ